MNITQEIKAPVKVRLRFIDMARSIAILLMLEGHFVDDSLLLSVRDPENIIYSTWFYIRGFTAPVFLTVTGLIFVYLLLKNREEAYFKNIRIKKGFKRVVELFFWGYMVQYYSFHVLECIAAGILSILIIFGIYKLVKVIPLWIYFFTAGILMFSFYLYMRELPKDLRWPVNAWGYIQNAFHGPNNKAIFPIVPWMGYTMFGAMFGALLHDMHKHVQKLYFSFIVLLVGVTLLFFGKELLAGIDDIINSFMPSFKYNFVALDWLYERVGMVFIILSILMVVDKYLGHRLNDNSLFLKVGQNTLTIYIIHMSILYGSFTGLGLNDLFHKNLGPIGVTIGAILFITFFVLLIKYLDIIKAKLGFILRPIKKFFDKLFRVA
jgi:uncharacterized membrane protein